MKVIGLNSTVNYLKVNLHTEKNHIYSNAELMRFLSKRLRFKYKNNGIIPDVCHQSDSKKTFGNTTKVIQIDEIQIEERHYPEFDKQSQYNYFKTKSKARNRNKLFYITPWMKTLDPPKEEINIDPPTYKEITKAINYLRSSASPSTIDQTH